ncbi:MAG: hypothetical protein IPM53_25095 [Anaerolineaceae bacterium]|nr:hypothetical protein [Anaerolineaceae bacterium]
MTFETQRLTLPELVVAIRLGHAWSAPHLQIRHHRPTRRNPNYFTTYRVKANVTGSQLLALDSDTGDERSNFSSLLEDPLIGQYAGLLHATASATPAQPRSRIIFLLDEVLETVDYELALKALLHRFPFCDRSVNHAAVVFYGARDCAYYLTEQLLPLPVLHEQIVMPYTQFLEAERQKRAAERAARLAAYGNRKQPSRSQVSRYVEAVYGNLLRKLASTSSGQGLRHRRLYTASLTVGGLNAAAWLTHEARQRLSSAVDDLLDAAVANGYVADYSEEDALRTIDNGLAQGELLPFEEPVWYAQRPFFQVGDEVQAVVDNEVKSSGRVSRVRETTHWEYEIDSQPNVWFARSHLQDGK